MFSMAANFLLISKQISWNFWKVKIAFLLLGLIVWTGCENYIIGNGPQPKYFDQHDHEPMLNIIGVLRPDNIDDKPLSFVHLEKSYPYATFPDTIRVTDASVTLIEYEENTTVDSIPLSYTDCNDAFETLEYRHSDFFPIAGHTYGISCVRDGFPELTSHTTIPCVPIIVDNSLQVESHRLTFAIVRDSLAALYDIFVLTEQQVYTERIRRPETGNTFIEMTFDQHIGSQGLLRIYAYDLQMSEYISYNISIKPNTFKSNYSTVENGFGCFGSLNILEETVTLP